MISTGTRVVRVYERETHDDPPDPSQPRRLLQYCTRIIVCHAHGFFYFCAPHT